MIVLNNQVVLKATTNEETASGLALSKSDKGNVTEGQVVSVGCGHLLQNGSYAALKVKENDRVLFRRFSAQEFMHANEKLLVIQEQDIIAIL